MSPVLSRLPRAPRSHPVKPEAQALGIGKGTTASGKPTGAPRGTALDEARRTTRGHQARRRGTPPATTKAHGQVPSNNGHRVLQTRAASTRRNKPRHQKRCLATPIPHTTNPSQEWQGTSGARTQAHTHPTPQQGVAGCSRNPSPSTHTHTAHPSQEWRGTSEARTKPHTNPNTPARSRAGPRATAVGLGPRSRVGQGPVRPPRGWAPEAEWGRAPCDRRGAGPQKPRGAGPRAITEGLGPRSRVGQGPVRTPWGWGPEAEWGRAPCDRRGAGPQKPSGARPCATAVGLGPRSRVGQGPVQPRRGWAPEAVPSAVQWSSEAECAVTTLMTAPLPGDPNFLPRRVCRIFQVGRVQPNPTQPSQEWRGAAKTRARAHTPTSHTPARSGGLQAERAHKHAYPNTPARRGGWQPKPEPKHTHPSQEWRGTSRART